MSGKWLNSRTYGLMTLLFSIPGILAIAVSQVYLPVGSLYALPLLLLGLLLVVVSVVFLFFFFTMQWRWTHGQPQPRPMRLIIFRILTVTLVAAQTIEVVQANPIIKPLPQVSIASDGSIQSSLNPLPISRTGNLYTLTGNISGFSLIIQCDNVTFDGNDYALRSGGFTTDYGMTVQSNSVTVKNLKVYQFSGGFQVQGSSNLIEQNQISGVWFGIDITGTLNTVKTNGVNASSCIGIGGNNNTVEGNLVVGGDYNLIVKGSFNNITANTITSGKDGIRLASAGKFQ